MKKRLFILLVVVLGLIGGTYMVYYEQNVEYEIETINGIFVERRGLYETS